MKTATIDRNPLHADFYADRACQARATVVENVQLARDTYRIRFNCPEIARRIVPGQFLMLRLAGMNDPLLGRPLALYDVVADASGEPAMIDVVYLRLGKMTSQLVHFAAGDELDIWGPLGNGFPAIAIEQLIMVAGGIGQTPFLALGKEFLERQRYGVPPRTGARASHVTLCYGVRTADYLAGVSDFQPAGIEVRLASDDGSVGRHGFVTEVLKDLLAETLGTDRVVMCCGPEPMMHAVADLCEENGTRCLVSLETPMACGIGICFSCVTKVRQADGGWDYKRTCVEGPVFDAQKIEW
ncbi:MAG TPA: dihydroorotate dehydrogenase electron transfer subunit [Lacipirellulaceae bacterium]|nr:dihydroorotate dehydrogenase electron transfer subunit [Lacipirellulaceae bacterium]